MCFVHLRFDECWVVLEGRSPVLVCFRVPDSQQATAAVHDAPLHKSDNVLNHSRTRGPFYVAYGEKRITFVIQTELMQQTITSCDMEIRAI